MFNCDRGDDFFVDLPQKTIENEYGNIGYIAIIRTSEFTTTNSIFLKNVEEEKIATPRELTKLIQKY